MSLSQYSTSNYLVPTNGVTKLIIAQQTLVAGAPYDQNWTGYTNNNSPFRPQGVYLDNTNGTQPLVFATGLGFTFTVPIGGFASLPFPASADLETSLTGEGPVLAFFVDYPVLPFVSTLTVSSPGDTALDGTISPTQDTQAGTGVTVYGTLFVNSAPTSYTNPQPVANATLSAATGNAWNAVAVAAAGLSTIIDTLGNRDVCVFGSVSAATDITVNISSDGNTFYTSSEVANLTAAGDFYLQFPCAARYIQLISSAAATITATISSK